MQLTELRARVQSYLDDDGTRWSNTELDRSLLVAAIQVAQDYAARGGSRLLQTTNITLTDGSASLVSIAPLSIAAVKYAEGTNQWSPVTPVGGDDVYQDAIISGSLAVDYVATPALPTSTNNMTWAGLTMPLMDELMCIKAARLCLTKDKEADGSLDQQYAELLNTVLNNDRQSPAIRFPVKRASALYAYRLYADVLQLKYSTLGSSVQR